MKVKMTVDEAMEFAKQWVTGMTFHEGSMGWRVVCMVLAEEVERLRQLEAERVPEGWKLVPVDPTDKMIGAGIEAYDGKCETSYRAMLAAVPQPNHDEALAIPPFLRRDPSDSPEGMTLCACGKSYVEATPAQATSNAAIDVLAERRRQVEAEGWTPEHDSAHDAGQMASAAACYAIVSALPGEAQRVFTRYLPWDRSWWKPADQRRNLVKAGALILAEIERLDRAAAPQQKKEGE